MCDIVILLLVRYRCDNYINIDSWFDMDNLIVWTADGLGLS